MPEFLRVEAVKAMIPIARELGIAETARGPNGFVPAYLRAGSPEKLSKKWHKIRDLFLLRNVSPEEQAKKEVWWALNVPTRRHLVLIMWAYSPDPDRLLRFLQGQKKK